MSVQMVGQLYIYFVQRGGRRITFVFPKSVCCHLYLSTRMFLGSRCLRDLIYGARHRHTHGHLQSYIYGLRVGAVVVRYTYKENIRQTDLRNQKDLPAVQLIHHYSPDGYMSGLKVCTTIDRAIITITRGTATEGH